MCVCVECENLLSPFCLLLLENLLDFAAELARWVECLVILLLLFVQFCFGAQGLVLSPFLLQLESLVESSIQQARWVQRHCMLVCVLLLPVVLLTILELACRDPPPFPDPLPLLALRTKPESGVTSSDTLPPSLPRPPPPPPAPAPAPGLWCWGRQAITTWSPWRTTSASASAW